METSSGRRLQGTVDSSEKVLRVLSTKSNKATVLGVV